MLYLHWHEHFELLVMKRGSAVFHIDSRPYAAAEGDVLIIPGGSLSRRLLPRRRRRPL
ncbi:AraC family ligand binding domain-containing protein [Paenibacillus sp. OAE614]|uniref:AraC family ligand binding domain-containing protein n=1 Tax=Paenibacillus sp. OAE614 TaxID=2663804 RepID=UPI003399B441